jgi:hypothetical protein
MTEDPSRLVRMLWDDHAQGTSNTTMGFAGTSSATHGKHSAAWYGFNDTVPHSPIGLDPVAGVKSLSFVVNGKLEDQGGLGFAVQDGYMLSATSCSMGNNPLTGRVDVAVRSPPIPFFKIAMIDRAFPGPQRRKPDARLPRDDESR